MKPNVAFILLVAFAQFSQAQGLEKLSYNHPGLVVDLGVGLWAWPIPCDADGDGDYDLIVSCPDKPSNGIWLFENISGSTSKNKLPVFKPARKLSSTVHYVMPSYIDGKIRVLSPGYEYNNFPTFGLSERIALPIPARFHEFEGKQSKGPKVRHNQWRYVDFDGDGKLDIVSGIEDWSFYGWDDAFNVKGEWTNGPLHGFVYLHRNKGTNDSPSYEKPTKIMAGNTPIDVFGCPSPNFNDFDNDGDLDLICGEFLDGFTYFENIGTRTKPVFAPGKKILTPTGKPLVMDLQMIVPIAFDWDNDGDFDLIVGDEDGRVAFIENVTDKNNASVKGTVPIFLEPRYFQQQADTLKSGALATPVGFDWDGDGDNDILSGNTAGYIEFFENLSGPKVGSPKWAAPVKLKVDDKIFRVMAGPNGSIQGPAEAKWGYTTLGIADWDGDGLPDIIYNSILGKVEWLKNIGTRTAPRLSNSQPIEVDWQAPTPKPVWNWWNPTGKQLVTQWRTTPVVFDMNQDGMPDLCMLDAEGYFVFFQRAIKDGKRILLPPTRAFCDSNGKPLRFNDRTAGASGRRKIAFVDWNGDGQIDLLLNSSNADLYLGVGKKEGIWRFEKKGTLAKQNIEGHDVSPTTVDFDNDEIADFLGGAEDGHFYWMKNPRSK